VSKFLASSSDVSFAFASVWNLQYSITLAKILEETFGRGMAASVPVSVGAMVGRGWSAPAFAVSRARERGRRRVRPDAGTAMIVGARARGAGRETHPRSCS
jgi:hypothetical protein